MIIMVYPLIALSLFTSIQAMIPTDNIPMGGWFFPKKECPLSQKMQRTIENLPGDTKRIATDLFEKALIKQHSLNGDLLVLMRLYGNKALLTSNIACHDYGSMKLTDLMPCYLELTFQTRDAVAKLFRYGAPKCYISPEKLTAETRIIEHQVLKTQCLVQPIIMLPPVKFKTFTRKDYIEFYMNILRQALPRELHEYISDKKRRPLHRLAMLAYDIQYREKEVAFKSKAVNDMRDIYAHMRGEKLSLSVVQLYTGSRAFERITNTDQCITRTENPYVKLVAEQLKHLALDRCSWSSQAESYAKKFIENVKKIAIVDDEIFS